MRQISGRGRCFCYNGATTPGPDYHEQRFYDPIGKQGPVNGLLTSATLGCRVFPDFPAPRN